MPYIFVRDYDIDLMEMNKELYHVFVDSVFRSGGERKVVYIRQHERGLPLTLRENYSDMGMFTAETEKRDIRSRITATTYQSYIIQRSKRVCADIAPSRELDNIQRLSPKLGGYLKKRMDSIGMVL